ncbi:MAG: aminoglycoside phosphotransferase [Nitrospirae bacterium GWC2_56_14]|nr:MAG: aminoglycoside phosphotransferase [Nitrospirae bacterium GWC2_56_14]
MPRLTITALTEYLETLYGQPVRVISMTSHGAQEEGDDLKGFGYGAPLFLEYEVSGERKKAVLETMAPSSYGHDHFSDRAQAILWEHASFNNLPGHVRSIDSGAFLGSGRIVSTGKAEEFFLLTEFAEGTGYFKDLERIRDSGKAAALDLDRALALADYLAEVHAERLDAPSLYTRRIRDLMGHGECIMGMIDNYPGEFEFITQQLLKRIEVACNEWRWRIKDRTHRLRRVHGDFHPWNILFRTDRDFTVLDRSRGEWGEPADDVATMTINYLFFSLQRSNRLEGDFEKLFNLFWDRYLDKTNDRELFEVIAPFYAWRGLVIASPIWYPHLSAAVRKTIFHFIESVLKADRFDPHDVKRYLA